MRLLAQRQWFQLAALALLVMCFINCRRRPAEVSAAIIAAGEPEVYSATLTRLAIDGEVREASASSMARRGDWRREQWVEQGSARAVILRPDLGKGYLLDLNIHLYVEFDFAASPAEGLPSTEAARKTIHAPASESDAPAIQAGEVERVLSDAPAPVQVETRRLADQTVQDHPC